MSTDFTKWIEAGRMLDLEGSELHKFVTQQQAEERDRRAEERRFAAEQEEKKRVAEEEARKFAAEQEEKKRLAEEEARKFAAEQGTVKAKKEEEARKAEQEAIKRREEAEERRRREEMEDRERQRQHELEVKRLELTATQSASNHSISSNESSSHGTRSVKLPMFEEEKDDLDAYLNRFERMCTSCGIRREDWTMQLARLLKGSALEVYRRLPDEDLDNFDELKRKLLKRFQLTESGFRQRFKQSRILPDWRNTFTSGVTWQSLKTATRD